MSHDPLPARHDQPIEPSPIPTAFFAATAVQAAGEYRQWNVVDGPAASDEGGAYVLRAKDEIELRVRIEFDREPDSDRNLA